MTCLFSQERTLLQRIPAIAPHGRVSQSVGMLIESIGPECSLGEICHVKTRKGEYIPCEVVGFRNHHILLMSLGSMVSIQSDDEVIPTHQVFRVPVSDDLLGRVINALGEPIDGKGTIFPEQYAPIFIAPPSPMERSVIDTLFITGVRAIDGLCTLGRGQRVGIFAPPGVGKSTLLSMIAHLSQADIFIFAMIGERGREVKEFVEKQLGEEGMKKSVVIAVTSDQSALLRARGSYTAMAIAEYFRDQGKEVLFLMDSMTRFAMALREIGLAAGEPPATKGYTPSVFAQLPQLLERAGNFPTGSITALYTILVEGDHPEDDPIAEAARSILDGHIILSRKLATSNHYPAIDCLQSLSRLMASLAEESHQKKANQVREWMHTYREAEDLINIGAYVAGNNPQIDQAIHAHPKIRAFLAQGTCEATSLEEMQRQLLCI